MKACKDRAFELIALKVDPRFEPLKNDERFERIVREVGLTEQLVGKVGELVESPVSACLRLLSCEADPHVDQRRGRGLMGKFEHAHGGTFFSTKSRTCRGSAVQTYQEI